MGATRAPFTITSTLSEPVWPSGSVTVTVSVCGPLDRLKVLWAAPAAATVSDPSTAPSWEEDHDSESLSSNESGRGIGLARLRLAYPGTDHALADPKVTAHLTGRQAAFYDKADCLMLEAVYVRLFLAILGLLVLTYQVVRLTGARSGEALVGARDRHYTGKGID